MTLHINMQVTTGEFRLSVAETLPMAGCTAVFGPSGAGKSTLLRGLAGFQKATGRIQCEETVWLDSSRGTDMPAHRRQLGYVFQQGQLFPHLNVEGNLRYAQQRAGSTTSMQWDRVVKALELDTMLARKVQSLSGGERQRVALGRALLSAPRLLLLDEPLSALDHQRKAEILPFLERAKDEFRLPMLYVSHSLDEVTRLADRVLVLAGGEVKALGETVSVLERLDVQSLTGTFEAGAIVTATVVGHDESRLLTSLRFGDAVITMPVLPHLLPGQVVRLRIRSRDVAIALRRPEGISIRNVVAARILDVVTDATSPYAEVLLETGSEHLRARITRAAAEDLVLSPGLGVYVLIKSVALG
jgi:molybdate transport system ATP-binding protein